MIIKFYPKYSLLIQNKEKIQTIRYWSKCKYKINDIVILDCKTKQYQSIITNISMISYQDLTNEIANKDGFKNLEDLKKVLRQTYFYIQDIQNTNFYIISWELL